MCPTPKEWVEHALTDPGTLLIDQANCEKKAAATAVSLLHRFSEDDETTMKLSQIAREELRHLELVLRYMKQHGYSSCYLGASRYASELRSWMHRSEPNRTTDLLLVCAMIEARSCERIGELLSVLQGDLRKLYAKLHEAEERHFEFYLNLAHHRNRDYSLKRLAELSQLDAELISKADSEFRFHSGLPQFEESAQSLQSIKED